MKKVFESVELHNLKVKNRLLRSATWEGAAKSDGCLRPEVYGIYDELARGGVGAIVTGFTSVVLNDVYFGGMMRLCDDALIPQYARLADTIHAQDRPVLSQIALGAFYRTLDDGSSRQVEPDHMTTDEIHSVRDQFVQASVRAQKAGFDGVQIHAAHFFFLSRFISPAVNHRADAYGGSTENRGRILIEILDGIKTQAPDLHVSVKINSSDLVPGGLDERESLAICRGLSEAGIDSIEVSGNGTSVTGIRAGKNEGYFVPFAARLADSVAVPVCVVGGMRSLETMEHILNSTGIALISLSRPLLCEPDLPVKMLHGGSTASRCVSCNQCYSSRWHKCVFRKAGK
ncbi:MAG: NADH:flavin oxidoreductase [Mailhella sp.]|nr:NADH:flavin oxidoreductase [Mailhella sp.]